MLISAYSYVHEAQYGFSFVAPPTIIRYDPKEPELNPRAGATVTLFCEAEGNPTPTITWKYNGVDRLPSGVQASGNRLVIYNIQSLMDGRYICEANHRFGPPATHEWIITVDNLQPPRNVTIIRSTYSDLYYGDEGFQLICKASK